MLIYDRHCCVTRTRVQCRISLHSVKTIVFKYSHEGYKCMELSVFNIFRNSYFTGYSFAYKYLKESISNKIILNSYRVITLVIKMYMYLTVANKLIVVHTVVVSY